MKVELAELSRQIELLRKNLNDLVKDKSFTDPAVIKASHRLDKILNQYNKLAQKK